MRRLQGADGPDAAAELLRDGAVVAVPTETVYGLAGRLENVDAVARIFEAKERPHFDPLIVHTLASSFEDLETRSLVGSGRISEPAKTCASRLIANFWPGPLTLVLAKHHSVPDLVTSGLDTVAIRSPAHPLLRRVLEKTGPVVAPSANRFGRISPTSAEDVIQELDGRIPAVLDGGRTKHGVESTIIGIEDDGRVRLLRPGALPLDTLQRFLGTELLPPHSVPSAPGMLASHYAPRKPLYVIHDLTAPPHPGPVAFLLQSAPSTRADWMQAFGAPVATEVLSAAGDTTEIAHQLFASMRTLDATDASWIAAEACTSETGLGPAIRDRLKRASAERSTSEAEPGKDERA